MFFLATYTNRYKKMLLTLVIFPDLVGTFVFECEDVSAAYLADSVVSLEILSLTVIM